MLDKVTIVIPTHNRHGMLEDRVLPHYLTFGTHILVVDSSTEPHRPSIDNPDIEYVHCPDEALINKLVKPVTERVKTPYMFLSADDTVTSPLGVMKCLKFLEENDDFSSAIGLILQCHYDNKERISTKNLAKALLQADSDCAGERMFQHFACFEPTFYSVQRTECWKNTLRRLPEEIVNYYLIDTYVAMMTVLYGKHAKLPVFYSATEAGPSINEGNLRYMCSPFKLATDSRYEVEVRATRETAVSFLMESAGVSKGVAELYVNGGLALYWLQDKKVKSFGDRIRNEWQSFLSKTFNKQKMKHRKAEKLKACLATEKQDYNEVIEALSDEDKREFQRLIKIVQTTYM